MSSIDSAMTTKTDAAQSMTGFARHVAHYAKDGAAAHAHVRIIWEIRSVNAKGLDARFRIPNGHDDLEQVLRGALTRSFSRGTFQVSLTLEQQEMQSELSVNEVLLERVLQTARKLHEQYGLAPATTDGILSLRGILDQPQAEADDEAKAGLRMMLISSFDQTLLEMKAMREQEGAVIGQLLSGYVDQIAALALRAKEDVSRTPEAIRQRLATQVETLLESLANARNATIVLDEARLHMEAAFLATKADIQEELDRLDMHVAAARQLLMQGGPMGRKLDFLSQEFNRETNTLCSKANAASITAIGLELKAVVDQFREQVQNLE